MDYLSLGAVPLASSADGNFDSQPVKSHLESQAVCLTYFRGSYPAIMYAFIGLQVSCMAQL